MGSDWDPEQQYDVMEEADSEGPEFDEEAAQNVMRRAAEQAKDCPSVAPDVPRGEGDVEVVFDGPKGTIVDVRLGALFSSGSNQAQRCIKNAFIGQIIPPFKGTRTVSYTVSIPRKGEKD